YALWGYQENGNSFNPVARTTTNADGTSTSTISGPVTTEEKTQKKNDVKARKFNKVYQWTLSLLNHYTDAKDIWENVKMILEGSELTKDDRESQLYDEFEHFRQTKGETIQGYYVRFTKLINDMKNIKMTMPRMQLVGSRNHFTSYYEPRIEPRKEIKKD
ncbi:hypothetical protein Tco_0553193, partial [Tanacetum coccineum]